MFIHRALTDELLKAARSFTAVIVTGLRRSGKTTLLRRLFPKASYHLLEDLDTVARLRAPIHARSSRRFGFRGQSENNYSYTETPIVSVAV
jgi:hypothetical protein